MHIKKSGNGSSSSVTALPSLTGKSISKSDSARASLASPKTGDLTKVPKTSGAGASDYDQWITPQFIPKVKERRKSIQLEKSTDSTESSKSSTSLQSSDSGGSGHGGIKDYPSSTNKDDSSNTSLNRSRRPSVLRKEVVTCEPGEINELDSNSSAAGTANPTQNRSRRPSLIAREFNFDNFQSRIPDALKDPATPLATDQTPESFNRGRRRSSASSLKNDKSSNPESSTDRPLSSLIEAESSVDYRHLSLTGSGDSNSLLDMKPSKSSKADDPKPRKLSLLNSDVSSSPAPLFHPKKISINHSNIVESLKKSNNSETSHSPSPSARLVAKPQRTSVVDSFQPKKSCSSINSIALSDCPQNPQKSEQQPTQLHQTEPQRPRRLSLIPVNIVEMGQRSPQSISKDNLTTTKSSENVVSEQLQAEQLSKRERRASLMSEHKKIINEAISILEMKKSPSNGPRDVVESSASLVMEDEKPTDVTNDLSVQFSLNFKASAAKPIVKKLDVKNIELLSRLPIFAEHFGDILNKMDILIDFTEHKKGSIIASQYQDQSHFHWILDGECRVVREIPFIAKKSGEFEPLSESMASMSLSDIQSALEEGDQLRHFKVEMPQLSSGSSFPPLERLGSNKAYLEYESFKNIQKTAYLEHYGSVNNPKPCGSLQYTITAVSDSVLIARMPLCDLVGFANLQMLYALVMTPSIFLEAEEVLAKEYIEAHKFKQHKKQERRLSIV